MPDPPAATPRQHVFQPPRGTRDFYPAQMLRRRWIEDQWRRTAIRHGFEEIDGPRFEHADLYTVKSGEEILSELFSFTRAGGETRFALRPEFTPTLARMVAARANSLPKPTKWFSVGPYFRAERPQRGRLREFLQWNVDIIGGDPYRSEDAIAHDAEIITLCIELLRAVGLTSNDVHIRLNNRKAVVNMLRYCGCPVGKISRAIELLDMRGKVDPDAHKQLALQSGIPDDAALFISKGSMPIKIPTRGRLHDALAPLSLGGLFDYLMPLTRLLQDMDLDDWILIDHGLVRGLAYYTDTVFEVHEHSGAERAIAGGGRYDNLIELFGGPPTPAVGFAMGDVVLANVLQDKGLMPSDDALRDSLGLRPDVFVISTGADESEAALPGVVSTLRRANLHARHTTKSTRNIGKLLKEAASVGARFALIIEDADTGALKNLDTGAQDEGVPIADLPARLLASARTAEAP